MFFAGGTFGHESEAREANRRPTGRRHQPCDMAELQTASAGSAAAGPGGAAVKNGVDRHVSDQKQMSSGPSFMDRMYEHDASATGPAHATRRHKSGPSDCLNVFSWKETDRSAKPPQAAAGRGPRAAREINATMGVPTAEDRRVQESKKFEAHSDSTFLKFSDSPAQVQSALAANTKRRAPAPEQSDNGVMGCLMRDQPQQPQGKHVQAGRRVAAGRRGEGAEDPGVAGFPGMGQRGPPRPVPQAKRAQAQPNSSPPWAQCGDVEVGRRPGEGSRRETPPQASVPAPEWAQPAYRLDEADFEDRYVDGDDAGAYQEQHRRTEEIEMYDDDDDHIPTQNQQLQQGRGDGRGHHLKWLDEQEGAVDHQYSFNPEKQEFHEGDGDAHGRHEYY
ncbi:hypothetical protein ABL78_6054 [Leptomonas seymouri]|uniref:Uncharacterized protein n=1 Tax=Leptomonas seymouri TaxID=5684 RepID=A0A0N0P454_LEPSE|nr:hypothetical protein ABL78_6054 [Leptomonas seymouri]|eukprot:KPI84899.1 hypothetical protein ABL78_6054 [Leptomonas seymouri]